MHAEPWTDDPGEAALAFLLRPSGHNPTVDRSAQRVLEVAHVFGDAVVDIRFFRPGETVRLGAADDFPVPVDLLPSDHHPFATHDGTDWVVRCGTWAGFVDEGEERAPLDTLLDRERTLHLGDDQTLVVEIGTSIFVMRNVWRSKRLPVPIVGDVDPVGALVAGAVGLMAALLGIVNVYTPLPPHSSTMDDATYVATVQVLFPKPEPAKAPEKALEAKPDGGGGGNGPTHPHESLSKRPGRDNASVVRASLEDIFGGIDAQLAETGLPADMTAGINGLIASNGTSAPGAGGLTSGRCLSADCLGAGIATGARIGVNEGARHGHGLPGVPGDVKSDGRITPTSAEVVAIGGISKSDIDAVVRRNLNQVRYCYTRELQRTPGLAGKVSVKFIIAKDGSVSSATIAKSSLGSSAAESCISGRFLRMQFPALKGGSTAIVNYPFVFAES